MVSRAASAWLCGYDWPFLCAAAIWPAGLRVIDAVVGRRRNFVGNLASTPDSASGSSEDLKGGLIMRRRLGRFLPIVMLALLVQFFAPIAACWAAAQVTADPLAGAPICSHDSTATTSQDGQPDQQQAHGGCCSLCCVAQTVTPTDDPQSTFSKFERPAATVVWFDAAPTLPLLRSASNAQARGPPAIS